jgi:hypothetical protein
VIVSCCRAVGNLQRNAGGWILRGDPPEQPIRVDPGADVAPIVVTPDGQWVLTYAFTTGISRIWDGRDGHLIKELEGLGATFPCVSPDGRWIRVGNDGGRLIAVGSWEIGPQIADSAVFAPEGELAAMATSIGIRLFERGTNRQVALLEGPALDLNIQTVFSPDGRSRAGWRLLRRHPLRGALPRRPGADLPDRPRRGADRIPNRVQDDR